MHLLALSALLSVLAGSTHAPVLPSIPKGQLVESIASESLPFQRFTVYLPTSYDPSRPAPIIYLMDPRGRARVAAKLFRPAAERYGYILMSSHNSTSDGPAELNLHAMQAMWNDSHEWFTIDQRRVYVAGFSGTARIASLMAHNLPNSITGIMGSAAAYHPDVRPSRDSKFLYFGTVGNTDYNFHEMESLEQALVSKDSPHRVERFTGSHSWMPPDLAMQAVEWMELRAMQSGTRLRDPQLIDAWWQRSLEAVRAALDEGQHLDAARRLSGMARDFAGLRDTTAPRAEAAQISSTPAVKNQLKRRQADGRRSREWLSHVMGVIADAFPAGADSPVRTPAELAQALELARLKRVAAGPPGEEALEAQRRLNEIEVQLGFYLPVEAVEVSEPRRADYYLSVALQIDDRSPVSWYLLGRTCAHLDAEGDALAALRRAFEAGFRDLALLEADPAFKDLRDDPGYAAIVGLLRDSGDVLDRLTVDRPPAHMVPLR